MYYHIRNQGHIVVEAINRPLLYWANRLYRKKRNRVLPRLKIPFLEITISAY